MKAGARLSLGRTVASAQPSVSPPSCPARCRCARPLVLILAFANSVDRYPEMAALDMTEDIIVLGGLATLFCWTYSCLPLIFYN